MSRQLYDTLCIVGPTACHKTEASLAVAEQLNGEIISADSVQVYIGMDIGSAKASEQERQRVPHHMIDCVPIDTPAFSVSQYRDMALDAIRSIRARNRLPVIVGGSGLYVDALTKPLHFGAPSDPSVRRQWEQQYDLSPEKVYRQLQDCDSQSAQRLHLHDRKRIVRALEVFTVCGRPLSDFGSDFMNTSGAEAPCKACFVGLNMERERLYRRIDARVDGMLQQGLVEEARQIYDCGYTRKLPAMQSIGYKQLFSHFDGNCSLDEAIDAIKRDTRRFAKRQLTWFRRDVRIQWFDVSEWNEQTIEHILRYIKENMAL